MTEADTMKQQWLEQDEQEVNNAINALLQHREGRRLLWFVLEIGKVAQQPFTGNALTTAFSCGELNVGQRFLDRIISVSPEGYVQMMKEQADERRERDGLLNQAVNGEPVAGNDGDDDTADS